MGAIHRGICLGLRASSFQCGRTIPPRSVSICRRAFQTSRPLYARASNPSPKKPTEPYRSPAPKSVSSSASPSPKPIPNPLKNRKYALLMASLAAFALSGYCSYVFVSIRRLPDSRPLSSQPDVSHRYSSIASSFDSSVASTERLMGITSSRRKLIREAAGDVLEVSIGTGRNLEFYDWDFKGHNGVGKIDASYKIKRGRVKSFTGVDLSIEMLEIAHDKFSAMFPGMVGARWVVADATSSAIPGPPTSSNENGPNKGQGMYDTVVQTMGLCSVSDPVALLRNLGRCVKEDEGRILLLEHGRGRWEWLNGVLDKTAEAHAEQFGCWWNRDLQRILDESGLEVVRCEQDWYYGGTNWVIELRRPKKEVNEGEKNEKTEKTDQEQKKWWR